jgi:pimeloyl-ACP methyl ester carboxylesterase
LHHARAGHDGSLDNPGYGRAVEYRIREMAMLGRIFVVTLSLGGALASNAALAQSDPVAGAVAGAIVGAAVATGAIVPYEHREPLREYVVRENRPSYRYEEEVVVGRELPPQGYESYPVPERYGVPGHHYTVINDRVVIYHPQTRRVIHVYDR